MAHPLPVSIPLPSTSARSMVIFMCARTAPQVTFLLAVRIEGVLVGVKLFVYGKYGCMRLLLQALRNWGILARKFHEGPP